jgi:DNA-binding protein YbaB
MVVGVLDPDEASAYLQNWKGRVDEAAANTRAMSERLAQLRVSATDDDGLAEVTIDAAGVLVDVRFTERMSRVTPDAVARAVLAAQRKARRAAAEQSQQIIDDTLGPDSVAGRTIAERLR